jgi:transposase InsO family protein
LRDRSSTPGRYREHAPSERDGEIERLRRQRLTGDPIARQLSLPRSTVGAAPARSGSPEGNRSAAADRALPARAARRTVAPRYKKLGRIGGVGHRITGRRTGAINRHHGIGWEVLHVCIDDASRLAYTELLPDEKKQGAVAFLGRALDWFGRHGVAVERIMTDNGSAYRSHDFRAACAQARLKHIRTRPYTPRTNGKAERFIRTSLREWAYARAYQSSVERGNAMQPRIANYNHTRPHSALGGQPPASKLNNVLGFNS